MEYLLDAVVEQSKRSEGRKKDSKSLKKEKEEERQESSSIEKKACDLKMRSKCGRFQGD